MPPDDKNLSNQAAEDTVFSNLGLTREELGITDDGSGNEDLDGSGNEGFEGDSSGNEGFEQPEGRMSQTRGREERLEDERRPISPGAEVTADKHGNLLHVGTGRLVAKAGKEARLYQDAHKARGQAQTLQGQLNDVNGRLRKAVEIGQGLHRELETMRANARAVQQFGLEQGEHLTALRLYKELRDNPKEALKNILTRAATNGINITELGLQGGVDPKSLVDMIKQEIGGVVEPIKQRTEAERRAAAEQHDHRTRLGQVQQQVDGFFNANPEAKQYLPVFTQTLQRFPDMTLGEIWARIQLHFSQNPQSRRNQNSPRRSLPQGRSAPNGGGRSEDLAPVTDSYDTIVKDALDKAGFAR
jgi:hypothetical protein